MIQAGFVATLFVSVGKFVISAQVLLQSKVKQLALDLCHLNRFIFALISFLRLLMFKFKVQHSLWTFAFIKERQKGAPPENPKQAGRKNRLQHNL